MSLPGPVAEVCAEFLALAPVGLVAGLHLHGGLAFGEWVAGHSDVDFVAVLDHRPDAAEVDGLAAAHEELRRRRPSPSFDGMHVVATDLATDVALLPPVPTVLEGRFTPAGAADALVAWHELALGAVTVHGAPLGEVWTDPVRLRAHTRANLDTYWRSWADRVAERPDDVDDWATAWCCLGAVRLDHLLATGRMTSKSAAGRWALATYPPRFHRVLGEALRIRDGGVSPYGTGPGRGRDVADLLRHVVG